MNITSGELTGNDKQRIIIVADDEEHYFDGDAARTAHLVFKVRKRYYGRKRHFSNLCVVGSKLKLTFGTYSDSSDKKWIHQVFSNFFSNGEAFEL